MRLLSFITALYLGLSGTAQADPANGGPIVETLTPLPADGGAGRAIGATPGASNRNCGGHRGRISQVKGVSVLLDFAEIPLIEFVELMACVTERNFILNNELKEKVKLISHQPVSRTTAKLIFESVLETHGYTAHKVGSVWKIIKISRLAALQLESRKALISHPAINLLPTSFN